MKKIISGKKYNTETATELGSDCAKCGMNDFDWWQEVLYQKKTGEFFLFGEGNARSRYSVSCGCNSWAGGSEIRPLTPQQAMKWAEAHLDVDTYESIFGEVEE